jgi:hypothetical protein
MTTAKASGVEQWFDGLAPAQREIAERVRSAVRKAAPRVEESIKWGRPVFSVGANIAYLTAAKSHITFGFFDGAGLADPDRLLEGSGKQMRSIKLRSAGDVPLGAIRTWMKQAVTRAQDAGSRPAR